MPTITPKTDTLVPINRIEILKSRDRNTKVFVEIVENVRAVGLKKLSQWLSVRAKITRVTC